MEKSDPRLSKIVYPLSDEISKGKGHPIFTGKIMLGKEDKINHLATAVLIHEKIPYFTTFNIMDHIGLIANMENPEAFIKHLKSFVLQSEKPMYLIGKNSSHC